MDPLQMSGNWQFWALVEVGVHRSWIRLRQCHLVLYLRSCLRLVLQEPVVRVTSLLNHCLFLLILFCDVYVYGHGLERRLLQVN